jgi:hypothetical protein
MPMVKTITAHNGCGNIQKYLEKGNRAIAQDFNLLMDEAGWAREMDTTRQLYGHDHGVTYRHFILSPDPEDEISVASLRHLATSWAELNFPDAQWAITYHIDSGIPHAHIVLNATDMATGRKVHISDARVDFIAESAQELATQLGLTRLDSLAARRRNYGRGVVKTEMEIRLEKLGIKTWKQELRDKVDKAITSAVDFRTFSDILSGIHGIEVRKTKFGYTYITSSGKKAPSYTLGTDYSPEGVRARVLFSNANLEYNQISIVETFKAKVGSWAQAYGMARTYELERTLWAIDTEGITSTHDFARRLADLKREYHLAAETQGAIAERLQSWTGTQDSDGYKTLQTMHSASLSETDRLRQRISDTALSISVIRELTSRDTTSANTKRYPISAKRTDFGQTQYTKHPSTTRPAGERDKDRRQAAIQQSRQRNQQQPIQHSSPRGRR